MKSVFARGGHSTDFFSDKFFYVNNCGYYKNIDIEVNVKRPNGRHDYQLVYVMEGEMCVQYRGDVLKVKNGAFLFAPGKPQCYHVNADKNTSYYWMHFSGSAAAEITYGIAQETGMLSCSDDGAFITGMKKLIIALRSGENELAASALGIQLISLFGKMHENFFAGIIGMMNRDIDEGRFDRNWAEASGMSRYHFIRMFRAQCGKTPHAYFRDLRMDRAKLLLTETNIGVGNIASMLGYDDSFYFSTVFKKNTGLSPRAYRIKFTCN